MFTDLKLRFSERHQDIYYFQVYDIITPNANLAAAVVCGEPLKNNPIEEFTADAEIQIVKNLEKEIELCYDNKIPFLIIIDITTFPIIMAKINKWPDTPHVDSQFSKDVNKAINVMTEQVNNNINRTHSDFKGYYTIIVNVTIPFTGLKLINF